MPVSPLPSSRQKTPLHRPLRLPLTVLALLVLAFILELGWTRWRLEGGMLLFHHTPNGWQTMPAPKGFPETMRVSSGGTVWVLTLETGLSHWDGASWQYSPDFTHQTGYRSVDFALDGEQAWTPTAHGMLHWDGQQWHMDNHATARFGASIVAGGGEIWVIDSSGKLSHFAKGQWQSQNLVLRGVDWSENRYTDKPKLARTGDGTLWLMRHGLWRLDSSNWTKVTEGAYTLPDAQMMGAAEDRVWLSDAAGLHSVSADLKHWAFYSKPQMGLSSHEEVYLAAPAGRRTYFAAGRYSLEFDGSNWRKLPVPDGGGAVADSLAAGPDGSLWIVGSPLTRSQEALRYLIYFTMLTPVAILIAAGWVIVRFRRRQKDQHQRVTRAVEHATGEVPVELEGAAGILRIRGGFGIAFLWIGTFVCYALLRSVWPKAPYWTIAAIALTIHLLMTFQESLIKRRPQPSDPIGPGAPSRYDWAKSWKAVAGAAALLLLVNLDRLPMLRFLRGYWLWIFVLAPVVYQTLAVHLLHRALRRGDYDGALNIVRWANFYNPWGVEPLRMSGHVLVLAGRYREAEHTLRRSLASSQARESYGTALEYLGDVLMEEGRYDEAMRSYEAALHAFPWRRRPYRGMAEMLLRRGGKPEQALEYIERIVDFSDISWRQRKANGKPQDDYWSLKAWALARVGRTSEVAEAIENALRDTNKKAAPDMATTHYRAALAMQALGNEGAATEHFQLAVQFDPNGRRGALAQAELRKAKVWEDVPQLATHEPHR
jgi:tetratricopeptide (TPR) repeat protein